jgi:excisionase family DNA binding protein
MAGDTAPVLDRKELVVADHPGQTADAPHVGDVVYLRGGDFDGLQGEVVEVHEGQASVRVTVLFRPAVARVPFDQLSREPPSPPVAVAEPSPQPRPAARTAEEVFTPGRVAELCRVSERTVCKWFDSGRLPGYRTPAGRRRIPRADLIRFLQEHGMPLGELAS